MKNDKQQPIEAKQFTFDQKDTVMGWARERGRPFLQGMYPKFGPNKEPILCIRHEQDEPIEVNINDWIVLTDKGLIACTPSDYESDYKQQPEKMKAIKKPIPVEFVKLEKTPQSVIEVYRFINGPESVKLTCNAAHDAWDNYSDDLMSKGYMPLKTLESGEGTQNANFGDYILKGIDGECWPVKADIFERTYDVQAPLSNETKVVESVEQAAKRFQAESYSPYKVTGDYKLYNFYKGFIKGVEYAYQFKNTDAVKVITDRIAELEKIYYKLPPGETKTQLQLIIDELKSILKIVKS